MQCPQQILLSALFGQPCIFYCFRSNLGTHYLLYIIAETGSLLSQSSFVPSLVTFQAPVRSLSEHSYDQVILVLNYKSLSKSVKNHQMNPNLFSLVSFFFPSPTYMSTQLFFLNSRKLLYAFPFVFFQFIVYPGPEIPLLLVLLLIKFHLLYEVFLDSHSCSYSFSSLYCVFCLFKRMCIYF